MSTAAPLSRISCQYFSEKIIRKHNGKIFKPEIATMRAEWVALKNYEAREKYILKRRAFVVDCGTVRIILPHRATECSRFFSSQNVCRHGRRRTTLTDLQS